VVYSLVFILVGFLISFSFNFPIRSKMSPSILILPYAVFSFFGLYILWFTKLWIIDVVERGDNYHTVFGWWPYFLVSSIWIIYGVFMFLRWRKIYVSAENQLVKRQIKYVSLGNLIYILSVLIFDVFIPLIFDNTSLFWFSPITALPFALIVTFVIVKHYLFKIKVLLTEFLLFLMWAALLVSVFTASTIYAKVLSILIFILSLIAGALLIRATHKETKAKEVLEQEVKKRTGELEEAKASLTIRVKARTRELEDLTMLLEQKVKARTSELEKRVEELEAFKRVTVDREIKMAELKKKIASFQKELKTKDD